jgi:hypothetical protein
MVGDLSVQVIRMQPILQAQVGRAIRRRHGSPAWFKTIVEDVSDGASQLCPYRLKIGDIGSQHCSEVSRSPKRFMSEAHPAQSIAAAHGLAAHMCVAKDQDRSRGLVSPFLHKPK